MTRLVPSGKQVTIRNIPPGATSIAQPLDVYFFRVFKDFVRRVHRHIAICSIRFTIAERSNILRILEVVWRQFCNPIFRPFLQYSGRKIGYIGGAREEFRTPVEACFQNEELQLCDQGDCRRVSLLRCSYCNDSLCFDHYVVNNHHCQPMLQRPKRARTQQGQAD